MTDTVHASGATIAGEKTEDLRRIGINPDFWYPVALGDDVRHGKTFAARFAGERIALYRSASGKLYALEDRCAHRQVPLSMGVVEGEALRCCYHAWATGATAASRRSLTCPGTAPGRLAECVPTRVTAAVRCGRAPRSAPSAGRSP